MSDQLPRPIIIPTVMTLRTLADVRTLLKHIPAEKRVTRDWQHVEATLQEGNPDDVTVVLQLVLQIERVPYTLGKMI
jgi:hypothetical protein